MPSADGPFLAHPPFKTRSTCRPRNADDPAVCHRLRHHHRKHLLRTAAARRHLRHLWPLADQPRPSGHAHPAGLCLRPGPDRAAGRCAQSPHPDRHAAAGKRAGTACGRRQPDLPVVCHRQPVRRRDYLLDPIAGAVRGFPGRCQGARPGGRHRDGRPAAGDSAGAHRIRPDRPIGRLAHGLPHRRHRGAAIDRATGARIARGPTQDSVCLRHLDEIAADAGARPSGAALALAVWGAGLCLL
ncbi:hypothetical protein D9M73_111740 [compost metagenome]